MKKQFALIGMFLLLPALAYVLLNFAVFPSTRYLIADFTGFYRSNAILLWQAFLQFPWLFVLHALSIWQIFLMWQRRQDMKNFIAISVFPVIGYCLFQAMFYLAQGLYQIFPFYFPSFS